MSIDLTRLSDHHPDLPEAVASNFSFLAAIALQRRHRPGVMLAAEVGGVVTEQALVWLPVPKSAEALVDQRRATEDGAEAIALGLAHAARRWVVHRRLQRRQHGDWLLTDQVSGRRVVLEVGGLDEGSLMTKLNGEVAQVQRSPLPYDRAVCVVRFADVAAILLEIPYAN